MPPTERARHETQVLTECIKAPTSGGDKRTRQAERPSHADRSKLRQWTRLADRLPGTLRSDSRTRVLRPARTGRHEAPAHTDPVWPIMLDADEAHPVPVTNG